MDIDDSDNNVDSHHPLPPSKTAVNTPVVHTAHSKSTATSQHDALPASSASLTHPTPSVQPETSPVMTISAQSMTTATMVSPAQPATTMTTAAPPQLGETPPVALSSSHIMPASVEAQSISGSAGVIVSEGGSAGIDAPVNSVRPPIARKKGKASTKSKSKTAPKRAKGDVAVGDTNPVPRRESTRTIDLKRKKMDAEVLDTQPAKKKKTTVKERWVYVPEEPKDLATS